MKHIYVSIMTGLWLAFSTPVIGQITGRVHQYVNSASLANTKSSGFARVTVRAYNAQGILLSSTNSDSDGNYRLVLPSDQRVRLEFSNWQEGFTPAPGQSRIQFVNSPAQVNLSLWQPGQYTGSKVRAVQSVYVSSSNKSKDLSAAIVDFSVNDSSNRQINTVAKVSQVGSLWGLAYARSSSRLFAAAFAKRHSDLGPLGSGGIYVTNLLKQDLKPFVDLATLGIQTAPSHISRDLTDRKTVFTHDSLMFSLVGKVGLGGMDVSDDEQHLWVMNLYDRKLYRITLPAEGQRVTSTDVVGFAVPNLGRRGEVRPFAVKYYGGKVYVGVVNDATSDKATPADLRATVLAFDPDKKKFEEVFSTSLNYTRGVLDYGVSGWRSWTDDYQKTLVSSNTSWMIYPQPILADIEFDTDGSIILGLMDRLGHQTGEGHLYRTRNSRQLQQIRGLSGGDVLRVAYRSIERGDNQYELEHNGQAGDRVTAGKNNGEGPDGGEFYFDDSFKANGITWHHETATGGLALLPEQNQLLVATREPEQGGYLGGGIKWFSNQTGASERSLSLLPKNQFNSFGKANNVGDVEVIAEMPPTEIGDRIWQDCDEDGIQDADEAPLANIEVGLYRAGKLLAMTTTDSLGHYVFTDSIIKEGIRPRTIYELKVATRQGQYSDLKLTDSKKGNNQEIDNDAVLKDGYAVISLETAAPGENLHNLDFGFRCAEKPQVTAKLICTGKTAMLTVNGTKEGDRFDITTDRVYNGNTQFAEATKIPRSGRILSDQFINWPEEITVRVFNKTGCFTDVFVRQTDAVGCESITKGEEVIGLVVSPNPTSDYLLVRYRSQYQQGNVQLLLRDIQGRVLLSQNAELKQGRYLTQLNMGQYQTGNYIIAIIDGDKQTSQAVIKR